MQARATTCGGYCSATSVLWLWWAFSAVANMRRENELPTHLSMVRRHANFVSLFDAGFVWVAFQSKTGFRYFAENVYGPLSSLPILITYGNGIREVKLKQISSTISRSTASSLCLSCSRTYFNQSFSGGSKGMCPTSRTTGSMSISPTIDFDFAACSGKRTE